MIIKNASVENEPILSNVGQVGEFRIRNSAKAFNILSSGLYANKIRAIIREYSCNAVDSHIEAGKTDTPFDVHLPNTLEPWFSVRDYGVGLDEKQVRDIFTTYFESTKSGTDELIGGLGLGSKSAFSYTDNFTIVAVKNGMKRVFTAFINEQGVPSIAPMGEDTSTEPTGVEIRFAVENIYDMRKFHDEARYVYKHFKLRPVVSGTGHHEFKFMDPEYTDKDIIPGVHVHKGHGCVAIMGNIEYPINLPVNHNLGDLSYLLSCGLAMEFKIGELDIQASREGLSYIPETIQAIKEKLQAVDAVLYKKLEKEVKGIKNVWEKIFFLHRKSNQTVWHNAVKQYILNSKSKHFCTSSGYFQTTSVFLTEDELAKKFNIKINAFRVSSYVGYNGKLTISELYPRNIYSKPGKTWEFTPAKNTVFVVNDTTVGILQRCKYHFSDKKNSGTDYVYVITKADRKKEMKTDKFFKALYNPPASYIRNASTLDQKERNAGIGKNVSILRLEKRDNFGHMRSDDMVWRAAADLSAFTDAETYYYLPLSGFQNLGVCKHYDMKTFAKALKDSNVFVDTIYGVRKGDLEEIKAKKNWINLDDHVRNKLATHKVDLKGTIKQAIGYNAFFKHTESMKHINTDSPYYKLMDEFSNVKATNEYELAGYIKLCEIYEVKANNVNVNDEITKYKQEMTVLRHRYPLVQHLDRYGVYPKDFADYINGIDLLKKEKNEE